jgi:hypothetical protein
VNNNNNALLLIVDLQLGELLRGRGNIFRSVHSTREEEVEVMMTLSSTMIMGQSIGEVFLSIFEYK